MQNIPKKLGRPKTRITVTCGICQKPFETKLSAIARGDGRYCNFICRSEAKTNKIPALENPEKPRSPKIERICESCGKTFMVYPYRSKESRPARFCNIECAKVRPAYRKIARK